VTEAGSVSTDTMALALPAPAAARRRRVPRALYVAGLFVAALVAIAVAAPLLAPHNPERGALRARLKAPTLEAPDGRAHVLGTDQLGRDVLSRMVFGTRVSLTIGFAAVALGGAIGGLLGLVAGFRGGWVDEIVMTVADAQLAFPFILLAIGIIAVLGPSFPNLIIVVGLSGWVTYARVLRSQVLTLRQRDFVSAILALGGSVPRVLVRHILPNVASTFMVVATLELARAIVLEATLSFLGLGIQPPTPSWGGMIHEGRGTSTPPGGFPCFRSLADADLARRQPHRRFAAGFPGPQLRGSPEAEPGREPSARLCRGATLGFGDAAGGGPGAGPDLEAQVAAARAWTSKHRSAARRASRSAPRALAPSTSATAPRVRATAAGCALPAIVPIRQMRPARGPNAPMISIPCASRSCERNAASSTPSGTRIGASIGILVGPDGCP
jgi:peptide/nickel transport system permease protein